MVEYERHGMDGLTAAIELTLSDRIDSEREIYLLLDAEGVKLAGNLDTTGDITPYTSGSRETTVVRDGIPTTGMLRQAALDNGARLLVGHDLHKVENIKAVIQQTSLLGIGIAMLLVLLGTYVFRQELDQKIDSIRRTAATIRAGQLNSRVPEERNTADEFGQLNRDINAMLDRIETLMLGVRHVSDTIAHNLRTPLTRLTGKLEAAQQPGLSERETKTLIANAIAEIEQLNTIFGKLLQIAEIEAGVKRQAFHTVSLNQLVADMVDMYEPLAQENGLSLVPNAIEQISLQGDVDLLASAIANLIENALKHAKSRIEIQLIALKDGTRIISVCDDGPGAPENTHLKLGTHFYRANSSTPGTGLGLTSVNAIVKLHKGQAHFTNENPGFRATLTFPGATPNMTKP